MIAAALVCLCVALAVVAVGAVAYARGAHAMLRAEQAFSSECDRLVRESIAREREMLDFINQAVTQTERPIRVKELN